MQTPTVDQVAALARASGVSGDAVLRCYTSPARTRVATHRLVTMIAQSAGLPTPPPRRSH